MIKICSLDFLRKETFETDILSADGRILCAKGDIVTPELILRLYFKEIYINKPLKELAEDNSKKKDSTQVESLNKTSDNSVNEEELANKELISLKNNEEIAKIELAGFNFKPSQTESQNEKVKIGEFEFTQSEAVNQEVILTDFKFTKDENLKEPEKQDSQVDIEDLKTETKNTKKDSTEELYKPIEFEKTESSTTNKHTKAERAKSGPKAAETYFGPSDAAAQSEKRPYSTDSSFEKSDQQKEGKGPQKALSEQEQGANQKVETVASEDTEETKQDKRLAFDEDQAKKIVENSIMLGKLLKYSAGELKELEQVAYYCNIGISDFKESDRQKKEFRKMKAYASYQRLLSENKVSSKVAEMVKFSATPYSSDSFTLSSKIPMDHIVSITSCFEDLLIQYGSKEEALLKMLQLGGNHFNIFILHKFITAMRDNNG